MFYLALLTGGPSSTLYWWEWVVYLFGFSSIIINALWLHTTYREKPMQSGGRELIESLQKSDESVNYLPPVKRRGKVTVYIGLPLLGILLMMTGYMIRDHQLVTSTVTYSDVLIQKKVNDNRFLIRPQWMRTLDSTLCSGSTVDWQEGETLRDWTFEQRRGCKRVISYHRYIKGEVDASVQVR